MKTRLANLQAPDSKPREGELVSDTSEPVGSSLPSMPPLNDSFDDSLPLDAQDTYFESREPSELIFCIILAAAYAGLGKFCFEPLSSVGDWRSLFLVEGLFATLSLLSLILGLRPYLSPSSLQISRHGIKYRGPYWPQRKTVNWLQIFRLYLSPELIIVVYHPPDKPTGVRILFIQSSYLSDKEGIVSSFARYAVVKPFYLKNPDWYIKGLLLVGYTAFVCWVLFTLSH